jgi:hypothetical protein
VTYNAGIIYDYPIAYYHDYPYTAPIVGPTATPLVSARFLRAVAAGGLLAFMQHCGRGTRIWGLSRSLAVRCR